MLKKTTAFAAGILGFALIISGCNQGTMTDNTTPNGIRGTDYNQPSANQRWNTVRYTPNANRNMTQGPNDTQRNHRDLTFNNGATPMAPMGNMGNMGNQTRTGQGNNTLNRGGMDQLRWGADNNLGAVPPENRNDNRNLQFWNNGTTNTGPQFGLIRANRNELDQLKSSPYSIDRNHLAQVVAQVISPLPGVDNVSVLVTDDHVYVGYDNGRTNNGKQAADTTDNHVRLAVTSVVPGYYKVHVSRDRNLTDRILQLTTNGGKNIDNELNRMLGDTTPMNTTGNTMKNR